MKSILFLLGSVFLISSCSITSSLKTSQRKINRQVEVDASGSSLINKPIVADVSVSTDRKITVYKTTNQDMVNSLILVSGTDQKKKKSDLLFSASQNMKNEAQNRAQFQFMEEHQCDYLVDPIYKVDVESTSGSKIVNITVEVSAYPANYTKFSQPDSLPKIIIGELYVPASRQLSRSLLGDKADFPSFNKNIKNIDNKNTNIKEVKKTSFEILVGYGQSTFNVDPLSLSKEFGEGEIYRMEYDPSRCGFLGLEVKSLLSNRLSTQTGINIAARSWNNGEKDLVKYSGNLFSIDIPIGIGLRIFKYLNLKSGLLLSYYVNGQYSFEYLDIDESESFELEKPIQTGLFSSMEYQSKGGFTLGFRISSGLGDLEWNANHFYLGKRF